MNDNNRNRLWRGIWFGAVLASPFWVALAILTAWWLKSPFTFSVGQ